MKGLPPPPTLCPVAECVRFALEVIPVGCGHRGLRQANGEVGGLKEKICCRPASRLTGAGPVAS